MDERIFFCFTLLHGFAFLAPSLRNRFFISLPRCIASLCVLSSSRRDVLSLRFDASANGTLAFCSFTQTVFFDVSLTHFGELAVLPPSRTPFFCHDLTALSARPLVPRVFTAIRLLSAYATSRALAYFLLRSVFLRLHAFCAGLALHSHLHATSFSVGFTLLSRTLDVLCLCLMTAIFFVICAFLTITPINPLKFHL